jgi:hypothetical protein
MGLNYHEIKVSILSKYILDIMILFYVYLRNYDFYIGLNVLK